MLTHGMQEVPERNTVNSSDQKLGLAISDHLGQKLGLAISNHLPITQSIVTSSSAISLIISSFKHFSS